MVTNSFNTSFTAKIVQPLILLALVAGFLLFAITNATANEIDELVPHPAIPLLDEAGDHVLNSGKPYSPRTSCGTGGCHDYEAITNAFHFETGRDEASDDFGKKSGMTHLVSPGYFGGYNCMGGDSPDAVAKKLNISESDFSDHGSAGYIKRCASCHAGGGWMEKDRDGIRYDEKDMSTVAHLDGDYYNRGTDENNQVADLSTVSKWDWKKSGVVENDCFLCHADFKELTSTNPDLAIPGRSGRPANKNPKDMMRTLRSDLIRDTSNFRYAATGILEFVNLNMDGEAGTDKTLLSFEREPAADGIINVSDLVLDEDTGIPQVNWDATVFDDKMKVVIPMLRYPDNQSCMLCHRTGNSRRGFYGFGDDAVVEYEEEDGILVEDYKDDVHMGMIWTEDNGEEREIRNCNSCHAKNYFKPAFTNVDLDANHDFPKGNSDMDVRNDLDYEKDPATGKVYVKSCLHCHEDAAEPAIPSGHASMRDAHRELWRTAGDMYGYPEDTLNRITQKHLDVITCEACHITDKQARGTPISPMYRYAKSSDGVMRMRPYKPRTRNYWKNKSDNYIFSKTERNSVFELKEDAEGEKYGVIVDPVSGDELGTVSARMSHGSWRFGNPEDYDTMKALKTAYDSLLTSKGITTPDAVMVVSEINHYVLSHGTKPAVKALQCEQCHAQKQSGAFSSLISPAGVLGAEGNVVEVTTLPDKRLVDDGIVVLDYPYMKVDTDGKVTANVADILYYSGINPSLSRLDMQKPDSSGGTDNPGDGDTESNSSGGGGGIILPFFALLMLISRTLAGRKIHRLTGK